jgi:PKD repeat protein
MKNKSILIVIGSILIIILIIVPLIFITSDFSPSGERSITLSIQVSNDNPRVDDIIYFNITNAPSGSNFTWDLGDGNISYGESISHTFTQSAYYEIAVTGTWENGNGFGNTTLGIKNENSRRHQTYTRFINLRPLWIEGHAQMVEIQKGISKPEIYTEVRISDIFGKLWIEIYLRFYTDETHFEDEVIETIDVPQYTSEFNFNKMYYDELPDKDVEYEFFTEVWLQDGKVGLTEIIIEANF